MRASYFDQRTHLTPQLEHVRVSLVALDFSTIVQWNDTAIFSRLASEVLKAHAPTV